MPKKINILAKCIVAILVILISISMITLFLYPLPAYTAGVCFACFEWGHGEECGLSYHGTTGCTMQSPGGCRLTGVACNQPPAY